MKQQNTYHIGESIKPSQENKLKIFPCIHEEFEKIISLQSYVPQLKVDVPGKQGYNICATKDDIGTILKNLKKTYDNIFIITDTNVSNLYKKQFEGYSLGKNNIFWDEMKAGEINKNMRTFGILINSILNSGATRNSLIVAFGGGVVGDISGYVAASTNRGIDFLQIPTTLISIFDASVGGKTGVDSDAGKNKIGAFHTPISVLVNPNFLTTLKEEDVIGGWVEGIIKHGVISSKETFENLLEKGEQIFEDIGSEKIGEVLMESIAVKAGVVSRDFKETGERATLNYGHTFGHALEVLFTPPLNHGVSVGYGIIFANFLSNQLGISSQSFGEKINKELIKKLQTQKLDSVIFNSSEKVTSFLMKKMRNDKKNIGNDINFILPANFGKFIKTSITETELRICIKEYFNYLEKNKLLV